MRVADVNIDEVDQFLAGQKTLDNGYPAWEKSSREKEMTARWNISDDLGIGRAHLRFRLSLNTVVHPSVSVIFRNNPICRVDICSEDECKENPLWASSLGLSAIVCGSHYHDWLDNREQIRTTGRWDLQARQEIQPQIKKVEQIVPWLAERINIELLPEQRGFDIPSLSDLFGRQL